VLFARCVLLLKCYTRAWFAPRCEPIFFCVVDAELCGGSGAFGKLVCCVRAAGVYLTIDWGPFARYVGGPRGV